MNIRKKYLISILILTAGLVVVAGCSRRAATTGPAPAEVSEGAQLPGLAHRNNQFAFDLNRALIDERGNFVFSPYSISTAMAMTYAGAREATLEQMASIMHFDTEQQRFHEAYRQYRETLETLASDKVALNIANSLWAQSGYHFLDSYFELLENYYASEVFEADFTADREEIRQEINHWVYVETRENIEDLIAPGVLSEDTRLVLVNAIHFFGPWLTEFDESVTSEGRFNTAEGPAVTADFMYRRDTLNYYGDPDLQILELPYAGKDFSMVLMLPAPGKSLAELERALDAPGLSDKLENMSPARVEAYIPRFKARTGIDLEETFMGMGMHLPFTRDADLSGMTGRKDLKIDKVIHQAMIEVAEEGTEAAAATAVVVIRKTALEPEERIVFNANRPFLFFVKDNAHDGILFMGRVVDPTL